MEDRVERLETSERGGNGCACGRKSRQAGDRQRKTCIYFRHGGAVPAVVCSVCHHSRILYVLHVPAAVGTVSANPNFSGLKTTGVLFRSDGFWVAFRNTVFLIFFVTIFTIGFALFFAAVLSKGKTKGKTFFRVVFYIPNILSIVVISAIFSAILSPSYGVVKEIANLFNVRYTGWLGNPDTVMWCIVAAMVWQAVGYYMVMYIAGMDSVPDHLYEAADLEGCSHFRQFFVITLPLTWEVIRTTLTFFIISTINMSFLFVDAMTQGEMNSHVLLSFMYEYFGSQYGYAMAIGTVVFVFAYAVSLIIQALTRREVVEY